VSTTEVKVIGQTGIEKMQLKFMYRFLGNFDANTTVGKYINQCSLKPGV
jgi:hypothetical protein